MEQKEEDTIQITMQIDPDWKGFQFRLDSTCEMTYEDIVLAIECWVEDNLVHKMPVDMSAEH